MTKSTVDLIKDVSILLGLIVMGTAIDRLEKSTAVAYARLVALEGAYARAVAEPRQSEPQDSIPAPRAAPKPRARATATKKKEVGDA